jgi:SAM-dependent methyltransferase
MEYPGQELDLFKEAVNWKRYFAELLEPHVSGRVLDVGCGMGVNALFISNPGIRSYTFLEPDASLLERVEENASLPVLWNAEKVNGTTDDLAGRRFDTVLYLDVLEHIADGAAELERAKGLLAPDGRLVVLAPAFNMLFSPFDRAVGHHRRYTRTSLAKEMPDGMQCILSRYLDGLGSMLSLGNRLLLRRALPTQAQIRFWDRRVVPLSRRFDTLFGSCFGRSLVAVYRKDG